MSTTITPNTPYTPPADLPPMQRNKQGEVKFFDHGQAIAYGVLSNYLDNPDLSAQDRARIEKHLARPETSLDINKNGETPPLGQLLAAAMFGVDGEQNDVMRASNQTKLEKAINQSAKEAGYQGDDFFNDVVKNTSLENRDAIIQEFTEKSAETAKGVSRPSSDYCGNTV